MTYIVKWEEIEMHAHELFSIWDNDKCIEWAKMAWQALNEKGLTRYTTEYEKQTVFIDLLTLANFYRQFCYHAFDNTNDLECILPFWLSNAHEEGVHISLFHLGRRLHTVTAFDTHWVESDKCEEELLPDLITEAIETRTTYVVHALLVGFGTAEALFLSMWNSALSEYQPQETSVNELFIKDPFGAPSEAWEYMTMLTSKHDLA